MNLLIISRLITIDNTLKERDGGALRDADPQTAAHRQKDRLQMHEQKRKRRAARHADGREEEIVSEGFGVNAAAAGHGHAAYELRGGDKVPSAIDS